MEPALAPVDAERLLAVVRQLAAETRPERAAKVGLDSALEGDLGFDSLTRVELLQRLGRAFGRPLPDAALAEAQTPRDLLRFLGAAAPEAVPGQLRPLASAGAVAPPAQAKTLGEVLAWHVAHQPQRLHVLLYNEDQGTEAISYGLLHEQASRLAAGLAARGLLPGQTVALLLPTGADYLASFFGVLLAGGIPVPIYPPARPSQLAEHLRRHARILANAGVARIVTFAAAEPVAALLRAALPQRVEVATPAELAAGDPVAEPAAAAQDIALLQYTSGSTGDPKGVVLSHANLLANIRAMGQAARVTSEDVAVSWLPLYHDMGLIGAWLGALYHGLPLVLMSPTAFLARPVRWLQAISRHGATLSGGPNFAFELCRRKIDAADLPGLDLSCWRFAFNGAEPVSPATLAGFAERFAPCGFRPEALAPVYGLAESSVALAFPPLGRGPRIDRLQRAAFDRADRALPAAPEDADALAIAACGRPLPGHELRIVDDAGIELPERRIGRLEFRGPSATRGYYRNAEASRRLVHDGWLDSGDNAYLAEGEVFITGRVKDLIIRGGRNVYPYDLEEAVGNVPGVRKGCVAAFASRRAEQPERLVIVAETRAGQTAALAELRRRIEQVAIETIGMPVDELVLVPPHAVLKTSSGKIRRLACREAYEQGRLAAGPPPRLLAARLAWALMAARLRIAARRAAAWAYGLYAWAALLAFGVPAGLLAASLRRPRLGRPIVAAAARACLGAVGLAVDVRGRDRLPRRPHVLLVNHASYLDVLLLTALLPATPGYAFAAKEELRRSRTMRALLAGLGSLFLERFDASQSAEGVEAMAQALRRGDSLLVFPEGTFTRQAGLRPFRLGAFAAAAQTGSPLVVAALRGARAALRDETWLLRREPIAFEIGATLEPAGNDWNAALGLREAARREMLRLCGEADLAAA